MADWSAEAAVCAAKADHFLGLVIFGVLKIFQSFNGTTGDSMSPTILAFPAMKPKISSFSCLMGTTFTTGFPRLVTMTGSPVAWISFITFKQRALKALARICFMVSSPKSWSY